MKKTFFNSKAKKYSNYDQYLLVLTQDSYWQTILAKLKQYPLYIATTKCHISPFKKICLIRLLTRNMLMLLLQYIGWMLTLFDAIPTPVSFASGTAVAFIFLQGMSIIPGLWLGSFVACYLAGYGLLGGSIFASLYTLEAILLRWLCYRFVGPTLQFYELAKLLKFIFVSAMLTAITVFVQQMIWPHFVSVIGFSTLWMANLNGILVFALALIAWDIYFPQINYIAKLSAWHWFCYISLFILLGNLIWVQNSSMQIWLMVAIILLTLVISLNQGYCAALTTLSIISFLLNFSAYLHAPLYLTSFANLTICYLQECIFFIAVFSLIIVVQQNAKIWQS